MSKTTKAYTFSPEQAARIQHVAERVGAANEKEVIAWALAVYDTLTDLESHGSKVGVYKNGEFQEVQLTPHD